MKLKYTAHFFWKYHLLSTPKTSSAQQRGLLFVKPYFPLLLRLSNVILSKTTLLSSIDQFHNLLCPNPQFSKFKTYYNTSRTQMIVHFDIWSFVLFQPSLTGDPYSPDTV